MGSIFRERSTMESTVVAVGSFAAGRIAEIEVGGESPRVPLDRLGNLG